MAYAEIPKQALDRMKAWPNLESVDQLGGEYDWSLLEKELGISDPATLNLGKLAFDRHVADGRSDR